jgi:hypothetical protein
MSFVRKNITIPSEQEDFLLSHNLSLSRVVQKTISYMMEEQSTELSKNDIKAIFSGGFR